MSVQPVQVHVLDPVASQARRPAATETAPAASSSRQASAESPRDAVTLSEQARQLAAASQSSLATAQDGPRLQLDFRKLRELAFPEQPRTPAGKK
jgi:hypothetical protein